MDLVVVLRCREEGRDGVEAFQVVTNRSKAGGMLEVVRCWQAEVG
jgi:hypothetical protein